MVYSSKLKQMNDISLNQQLANLLQKSQAHTDLDKALEGLNAENRGKKIENLPYTIWQLVEHIRIVQQDLLDFSENTDYEPMNWPDDYWPKEAAPKNEEDWKNTLLEIKKSNASFIDLISDENRNLLKPFPHGDGQNLFREAILMIDHRGYHVGEIILIRRLLGNWE